MCLGLVLSRGSVCHSFRFNSFEGLNQDEILKVIDFYRSGIISGAWMGSSNAYVC
jgi:hypothetical protein